MLKKSAYFYGVSVVPAQELWKVLLNVTKLKMWRKCGDKFTQLVAEGFWQWVCMRKACCWEPSKNL